VFALLARKQKNSLRVLSQSEFFACQITFVIVVYLFKQTTRPSLSCLNKEQARAVCPSLPIKVNFILLISTISINLSSSVESKYSKECFNVCQLRVLLFVRSFAC
jgi:hypothetical protein